MKILILCLPGIGDALMATPLVKLLRKHNPQAIIDVVCMFDGVKFVFENNPDINNVYRLNLYKENPIYALSQLMSIRAKKYDKSVLTFPSYRKEYRIVQWLIGARERIGHKFIRGHFWELGFLNTIAIPVNEEVHNVINNLNLLGGFGIDWRKKVKSEQISYELHQSQKYIVAGKKYLQDMGWEQASVVGIHPGSTVSKAALYKRWPIERYASVIQNLIRKKKKVLIFAGNDELDLGRSLQKLVNDSSNCRLVEGMDLRHSIGIVSHLSLMICNDNGFAHLANAVSVPGIVLFGPTNPAWCSPYNKKNTTIIRKASFEPWFRNDMKVTHPPKNVKSGMEEISIDDVIKAIEKNYAKNKK